MGLLSNQRRQNITIQDMQAREIVPVVARYTSNAGQSISDNTVSVVNFEDETFDPRDTVTVGAGWVFTCPVAGYYRVSARVQFVSSTAWANGELIALDVYVNGAQVARLYGSQVQTTTANERGAQGSTVVHLDRTDTLNIRVLQASGGALALTADTTENHVSIGRITP
jgi:hypothetical protein